MPIVKRSTSVLGNIIAPQIKSFMQTNANALATVGTIDDGLESISQAIAYGIAVGLKEFATNASIAPTRTAAMAPIVAAPPGAPVGAGIDAVLNTSFVAACTEV